MEPYQERVVIEKAELDERLRKLEAFVSSKIFISLPLAEMGRLQRQRLLMAEYSKVLDERIANF